MGPTPLNLPVLLGQAAELTYAPSPSHAPTLLLGMLIVGGALIILVPVVMGVRTEHRKREMEHAERMRAIELGRPFPGDAGWWSPGRTAVGIGVAVPISIFGIAFVASLLTGEAAPFIWPSAGAIGLAAVICGTVLASRVPTPRPQEPDPRAKPYIDPDAYDAAEHQHA
jgi:hypothetical protein